MAFFRRGRFLLRLTRELSHKYTVSLVFGFLLGLFGSIGIIRLYPYLSERWLAPVDRIGLVGDFTPTTLPIAVQKLISGGLTSLKSDGTVGPELATSWEATDSGKIYLFKLQDSLKWHNGKTVEARDVNYNIRNVTFAVVSPTQLRAELKEPFSPFPSLVDKPIFLPGLVGFGPYRVSRIHLKGDSVEYLRLTPVKAGESHINEYRFYRTEAQAIIAYKRGDVDILEDLTSQGDLARWSKTKISEHVRYNRIVALFFNLKDSRLGEKSFRQALAYAIPDLGEEEAIAPISKNSWAATTNVRRYAFDAAQVKKLLGGTESGTSSAQLNLSTFAPYDAVAETIAKSWTALGIPTVVRITNDLSGGYQILLSAQNIPPDPDQYPFWHSTQTDTNITGYVNVKIDKLLEDGRRELDQDNRQKIYADFARRLVDDAPAIFLYYPKTYTVVRGK